MDSPFLDHLLIAMEPVFATEKEDAVAALEAAGPPHRATVADVGLGPQLHMGHYPRRGAWVPISQRAVHRTKPVGGLWTSSAVPDGSGSDWTRWLDEREHGAAIWPRDRRDWWLLRPDPSATLLVVDGLNDLHALLHAYGFMPSRARDPVLDRALNVEELARDGAAGLHLTRRGQEETRYSIPDLYGWDCESTVWFRWSFVGRPQRMQRRSR